MRRRPIVVAPRRGPSLVGTMARTAVIAGTATAVAGATSNAMQNSAQQKAAQQQAMADQAAAQQQAQVDAAVQQALADQAAAQQQVEAQQVEAQQQAAAQQAAAQQAAPAAAPQTDILTQLQKLGELKAAGILTDEEFEAQKARILAGS